MRDPTRPRPTIRLPLQVGTTAAWSVARAAIALVPGLAIFASGLVAFTESGEFGIMLLVAGGLFVTYAGFYLRLLRTTRASDFLVFERHLRIEGGEHHGTAIAWSELASPWAGVEEDTSERLILWKVPFTAMAAAGGEGVDPTSKIPVWRLWVMHGKKKTILAETDRPGEARSLRAAAATIAALNEGKRHVSNAQRLETELARCASCTASLVPDEAEEVVCAYCRATVPMPERFRKRAASVKTLERSRTRTTRMIASLLEQPGAARTNAWLAFVGCLMFAAWPIGWGAVARHVLADGLDVRDAAFLASPLGAVLGFFLFARGHLADRGAMQLLTLGFGALAPEREGDPSLCRRCHGPLPDVGLGGIATCRYCEAENIVGIDLRPVVDRARREQKSFDGALATRRRERLKWGLLGIAAVAVLAAWARATIDYVSTSGTYEVSSQSD